MLRIMVGFHMEMQAKIRQIKSNIPSETTIQNEKETMASNVVEYEESSRVVTKGLAKRPKSSKE